MMNINPFGWVAEAGMPSAGMARVLRVVDWPAHASHATHATAARAPIAAAAQRKRRTAATHTSVDGGFI
jgi:hypothetical protein